MRRGLNSRWSYWNPADAFVAVAWQQVARHELGSDSWVLDLSEMAGFSFARIDVASTQQAALDRAAGDSAGEARFWIDPLPAFGARGDDPAGMVHFNGDIAGLVLAAPVGGDAPLRDVRDPVTVSENERLELQAVGADDLVAQALIAAGPVSETPLEDPGKDIQLDSLEGVSMLRLAALIEPRVGLTLGQAKVSENPQVLQLGDVSLATIGADLADLLGPDILAAGGTSFVGADSGSLTGHLFLVVDRNGKAGYQAGEDEVLVVGSSDPVPSLDGNFFGW